jgi:hypothetical protein
LSPAAHSSAREKNGNALSCLRAASVLAGAALGAGQRAAAPGRAPLAARVVQRALGNAVCAVPRSARRRQGRMKEMREIPGQVCSLAVEYLMLKPMSP